MTTRPSFRPVLAILFVAGAIYATIANQEHGRPSSPPASVAKQPEVPPRPTTPAANPIRSIAATQVRPAILSPVQSLEIAPLPPKQADPPIAMPSASADAALEMVAPAAGCEKLPSYATVSKLCRRLDQPTCNPNPLCSWTASNLNRCYPKEGVSASSNPLGSPGGADFIEFHVLQIGEPDWLQIGSNLVSQRNFDRGIATYSQGLQSHPNWPEALMNRAMAYEAAGDTSRAIADYCKILVIFSKRERRVLALERIAQLEQAQSKGINPVPMLPATKPALPSPPTGDIQSRRRRNAIAPFTVLTESGQNYLIKLVNVENARDQIWIYVKGGDSYSTKVAVGTYNFRAAAGNEWYGRAELFGPTTRFFRLRLKNGAVGDARQTLQFSKERNRIVGMTISLKGVADGNMEQETMTRSEFDAN